MSEAPVLFDYSNRPICITHVEPLLRRYLMFKEQRENFLALAMGCKKKANRDYYLAWADRSEEWEALVMERLKGELEKLNSDELKKFCRLQTMNRSWFDFL